MADKKDKLNSEAPQNEIADEMEELAKVFKEELEKAKAEAKEKSFDIDSLEVDGYNPREVSVSKKEKDKKKKKDEKPELCEYCNQKPQEPGSKYCAECEELLEKYPLDYKGIIAAVAVICIAVAAVFCFAVNVPIFSAMMQGDKAADEGKLYTAMAKYDEAVQYVNNLGSNKSYINLYAKRAVVNYNMVNMNSAITEIDENIPESVLKLPTFKKLNDILDETERMQASAIIIQEHLSSYPEVIDEENYNAIIKELDSLVGKKIYITKDGKYHDETQKDFKPDGSETVYICDEGWIYMYKYAAAQSANKDEKIIASFLQKCADSSDYLNTLAGGLLATTYAGIGEYDKAEALAKKLHEKNQESIEYQMILSAVYRYRDKDYKKAIAICDEGEAVLQKLPNSEYYLVKYGYMVQLQKTLSLIMLDENDSAYDEITEVYWILYNSNMLTAQVRDLYAMLAIETGDEETYKALEEEIKSAREDLILTGQEASEEIDFGQDVKDLQDGKLTLKEIAASGRYDLV